MLEEKSIDQQIAELAPPLTEDDYQAQLAKLAAQVGQERRKAGIALMCTFLLLGIGAILPPASSYFFLGTLVSFVAFLWCAERRMKAELRRSKFKSGFEPATIEQISALQQLCTEHPRIAAIVRGWMEMGLELRSWDVCALENIADRINRQRIIEGLRAACTAKGELNED